MHNSLVTVGNGGNQAVRAELTILYNQGREQYQMEQKLAPEEQMLVDFGKLIHDRIPDKSGHVLPPDVTSGAYRVRDLTDQAVGNLYEGKVIVDKTNGHAAYGCAICCGYTWPMGVVFDPLPVAVSGSANQKIMATNGCTQQQQEVTWYFLDWWTDDTAIATAQAAKITGVSAGSTNHNAQSILMSWSGKTYGQCPQSKAGTSGGTNVCPNSTTTQSLTPLPLSDLFLALETGIGAEAAMKVGPAGMNWNGYQITEAVVRTSNSCPANWTNICTTAVGPGVVGGACHREWQGHEVRASIHSHGEHILRPAYRHRRHQRPERLGYEPMRCRMHPDVLLR